MHKKINTEQYLDCQRYRYHQMREIELELCCLVGKIRALRDSSFNLIESRVLENEALKVKGIADWLMLYSKGIEKSIIEIQVKRYSRDIKRKEKNYGREGN